MKKLLPIFLIHFLVACNSGGGSDPSSDGRSLEELLTQSGTHYPLDSEDETTHDIWTCDLGNGNHALLDFNAVNARGKKNGVWHSLRPAYRGAAYMDWSTTGSDSVEGYIVRSDHVAIGTIYGTGIRFDSTGTSFSVHNSNNERGQCDLMRDAVQINTTQESVAVGESIFLPYTIDYTLTSFDNAILEIRADTGGDGSLHKLAVMPIESGTHHIEGVLEVEFEPRIYTGSFYNDVQISADIQIDGEKDAERFRLSDSVISDLIKISIAD